MDAVSSRLRGGRPSSMLSEFSSKASIPDGMGEHRCMWYGQLLCSGRNHEYWKVYEGFRETYVPLQMTSVSGKALCISAGQYKTGQHGGLVVSTVASQQDGSLFKPWQGPFCVEFACSPPGTPASSHNPKIGGSKLPVGMLVCVALRWTGDLSRVNPCLSP